MRTVFVVLFSLWSLGAAAQDRDKTFNVYNRSAAQVKAYADSFFKTDKIEFISDSSGVLLGKWSYTYRGQSCYPELVVIADISIQCKHGLTNIAMSDFRYFKKTENELVPLTATELRCILKGSYNDCQTCNTARDRFRRALTKAAESLEDSYHRHLISSVRSEASFK